MITWTTTVIILALNCIFAVFSASTAVAKAIVLKAQPKPCSNGCVMVVLTDPACPTKALLYDKSIVVPIGVFIFTSGEILSLDWADLNFEQRPNRDSRVLLGSARDALGQRKAQVDWRLTETDWRTARVALQTLAQESGRTNLGRVRTSFEDEFPNWPGIMTSSFHHMGGARMSATPDTGVVNADCRLHSVDNLYVAGSAVFPTSGYANPTLTIVALSLRLADHIAGELS